MPAFAARSMQAICFVGSASASVRMITRNRYARPRTTARSAVADGFYREQSRRRSSTVVSPSSALRAEATMRAPNRSSKPPAS